MLGRVLLIAGAIIGLSCASSVAVIAIARFRRGRAGIRSRDLLAPYRRALTVMASGEDALGQAKAALYAVPAPTWDLLRPSVVAFLPKVRGAPADDLGELLRSHGEIERATRMLASVLENVGYRQATAWRRLEGWWASLRGKKQVWGTMTRQGFDDESRAETAVNADD